MNKVVEIDANTGSSIHIYKKLGFDIRYINCLDKNSVNMVKLNSEELDIKPCNNTLFQLSENKLPKHDILSGKVNSNNMDDLIRVVSKNMSETVVLQVDNNVDSISNKLQGLGYKLKHITINLSKYTEIPHSCAISYTIGSLNGELLDCFDIEQTDVNHKNFKQYLEEEVDDEYIIGSDHRMYHDLKNAVIDEDKVYILTKFFAKETPDNIIPHLLPDNYKPIFKIGDQIRILSPEEWFNLYGYPGDYELVDISADELCEMVSSGYCYSSLELVVNWLQKGYIQYKDKYLNRCKNLNYVTKNIGNKVVKGYNFKDGINLNMLKSWLKTYSDLTKQAGQLNINLNGSIPQNMMINIHCLMNNGMVVSSIDDNDEVNMFYNTDSKRYEMVYNINFETAQCDDTIDNYCYYFDSSTDTILVSKISNKAEELTVNNIFDYDIYLEIKLSEQGGINLNEEIEKLENELRLSKKRSIRLFDSFNKIVS